MSPKLRPHMQRRSMLRVQQLDMFLHLAESRSISITANKMCLTPSAVTKSLKELESQFGAMLFERTTRGLRITESGKAMERYAESVVLGFESVMSDIQGGSHGAMQDERIGHTPDVGQHLMVRLIAALRAEAREVGEVRVLLQVDEASALIERLRRGELDYAILHAPSDLDLERFVCLPLGEESLSMAVRPEHPLLQQEPDAQVHPKGLLKLPWVLPAVDSPACRGLKDSLLAMGLPFPNDVVHSSCPATTLDLALSLDLVALMPASTLAPLRQRGHLRRLKSPFPMPTLSYSVVYPRRSPAELEERRVAIRRILRLVSPLQHGANSLLA